ncbi:MAG: VOC family protein [Caulobacterales bacterium]|jgi:catechol 2,3-dioxygenase-like lactoylglutathione lyase family enzyme
MSQVFPDQRFSTLTIGVDDRAAMTRFYTEVLGFVAMEAPGITFFDMGGIALGLWENDKLAKDAGAALPQSGGYRGFALGYVARSEADVDAMFARLAQAGAVITQAPHKAFWGGYSGYFADPEGNAWEVAYNPFWPVGADGRLELPKAKGTS